LDKVEGRRLPVNKSLVCGIVAASGLMGIASTSLAQSQAPATAQVWNINYQVTRFFQGFAQGSPIITPDDARRAAALNLGYADDVRVVLQARVGIRAGSWNTNNFGVSKVGGSGHNPLQGNDFSMTWVDAFGGPNQGTLSRGTSTSPGEHGMFDPFRAGLTGDDDSVSNGLFFANAAHNNVVTNIVGGNTLPYDVSFGNLGIAVVQPDGSLVGEYSNIFAFDFNPQLYSLPGNGSVRNINVSINNLSVRYIYATRVQGGQLLGQSSSNLLLPNSAFSFSVPTPGAAGLLGLAGIAAIRRRRAA
jgi:MYXO-CTERM domain-containing protein